MKLHIITIGSPKLNYAQTGWKLYIDRLQRYHTVRVTHIADNKNDSDHIEAAVGSGYSVALVINGPQMNSEALAAFIDKRANVAQELCFIIGGPDGLPKKVIDSADRQWGLSELTFPHDLAMVILAETLYRASTISAGQPYHH
jgi:23S rRNA (pseudouridine1915-N3)-methyltransferase